MIKYEHQYFSFFNQKIPSLLSLLCYHKLVFWLQFPGMQVANENKVTNLLITTHKSLAQFCRSDKTNFLLFLIAFDSRLPAQIVGQ